MRVLCILSDGFEELEALGTIALLRRSGIEVDVFALEAKQAKGRFDLCICEIGNLDTVQEDTYDALFLPGGPHYEKLLHHEKVLKILDDYMHHNKLVCAICAAPTILGKRHLLKNRKYTCFTSMNEDFSGTYVDQYVVVDGMLITGRSAAATIDFAFAIIEKLCGTQKMEEVKAAIYY